MLDGELDTLLNPSAIFEVLSPSTESYDRRAKFKHYQKIESFRDYILVAQDLPGVDHFVRGGGDLIYSRDDSLDESLRLDFIAIEIPLAEIYEDVAFAPNLSDGPRPRRH